MGVTVISSEFSVPLVPVHINVGLSPPAEPQSVNKIGEVTVDLSGLLSLLEMLLGLNVDQSSFTTRLVSYLACIESMKTTDDFYAKSYEADPFSVAKTLLSWRDQWYEAGWNGVFEGGVPSRLQSMAAIEAKARGVVAPSRGERLQRVISLLRDTTIPVGSVVLLDDWDGFSHLWQQLFRQLGVDNSSSRAIAIKTPIAKPGSDLYALQTHLIEGTVGTIDLQGDGSLRLIEANNTRSSAKLVAAMIGSTATTIGEGSFAVLAESRGDVLDDALESINAPRLGFSTGSSWRPVLQLLPLVCELVWDPLRPTVMLQFLTIEMAPLPVQLRLALAETMASKPGIDGPSWQEAIAKFLSEKPEEEHAGIRRDIQFWLAPNRHNPIEGVSGIVIVERAKALSTWLAKERGGEPEDVTPLFDVALNQCEELVKAVERLADAGRSILTRDHVLRLIEDIRGQGTNLVDREAQVAAGQMRPQRATHTGALTNPVDKLVWWDAEAVDSITRWPWYRHESEVLEASGVLLQTERSQLAWLSNAWLRPLLSVRERCDIVVHGDGDRHHPLLDLVFGIGKGIPSYHADDPEVLSKLGIDSVSADCRPLPRLERWLHIPAVARLPGRVQESFSSFDAFINSPYQWLLRYHARIKPSVLFEMSDGALLKGNLVHHFFEQFFNEHKNPQEVESGAVATWAALRLPALMKKEGAVLLEPGRLAESQAFQSGAQRALLTVVEQLKNGGFTHVASEVSETGEFCGGYLKGTIDLVAKKESGQVLVIDVKWGGRNYRRASLQEGEYLQLAVYAHLLRGDAPGGYPALSYFIASEAHFLNFGHELLPNGERLDPPDGVDVAGFWRAFEHTWQWRRTQFDEGRIEVTMTGTEADDESQPGSMGLILPETADTFNDYRFIMGWGDGS